MISIKSVTVIRRRTRVLHNGLWSVWYDDNDPKLKHLLTEEAINIETIQTEELIATYLNSGRLQ